MIIYTSLINSVKTVKEEIDFSEKIVNIPDIISIKPCYITGEILVKNEQLYTELNIKVDLVLASSRSMEPIDYKLDFDLDLIFGSGLDSDFPLENEINLGEIIYGHILLEKPISIYLESETPQNKPKVTNPAFKGLKDWNL